MALHSFSPWSPVIQQSTAKHHAQSVKMALTLDLTPKQYTFGESMRAHYVFLIAHGFTRAQVLKMKIVMKFLRPRKELVLKSSSFKKLSVLAQFLVSCKTYVYSISLHIFYKFFRRN